MSVYPYKAKTIKGNEISLQEFEGKVLLIVNTASECGFTPQFTELQSLFDKYHHQGFTILGFPCNQFGGQEPGNDEEIAEFCSLNYGVNFPMFSKIDVKGEEAHPLFIYLSDNAPGIMGLKSIKWNFTKFLVDRSGKVIDRYAPNTSPNKLVKDIESLLN